MAHTRRTLALNDKWDIGLSETGNIALTQNAIATAQNVANECRLFINDAYFTQDKGSPYFAITLGRKTNSTIIRSYLRRSALRVDDVREVLNIRADDVDVETRILSGDIQFITREDSQDVTVELNF